MLIDIAKGLKSMHKEKWIHCDIKLDNFIWYRSLENGRLSRPKGKIIDLGNAKRISANPSEPYEEFIPEEFEENQELYPYMAPEILLGKTGFTLDSEIYAFGIVLEDVARAFFIDELLPLVDKCTHEEPNLRPHMAKIVKYLKKIMKDLKADKI